MKLIYKEETLNQDVVGIQAGVIRDDLNGSSLVIQGGKQRMTIKLSDLLNLIEQQKFPLNPVAEGSKGDSEAE